MPWCIQATWSPRRQASWPATDFDPGASGWQSLRQYWPASGTAFMFLMAGGCIHHQELQESRATSLGTARSGAVAALGGGIAAARSFYGAEINSVSTTLLIAARLYELHRGRQRRAVRDAQRRGREFLLVHRL